MPEPKAGAEIPAPRLHFGRQAPCITRGEARTEPAMMKRPALLCRPPVIQNADHDMEDHMACGKHAGFTFGLRDPGVVLITFTPR